VPTIERVSQCKKVRPIKGVFGGLNCGIYKKKHEGSVRKAFLKKLRIGRAAADVEGSAEQYGEKEIWSNKLRMKLAGYALRSVIRSW